jgi:cupin fold WbuC family metalloprotein
VWASFAATRPSRLAGAGPGDSAAGQEPVRRFARVSEPDQLKPEGHMIVLHSHLLDSLSAQAKSNPRLRKNLNLHTSYEEPSQRLLNAMEPDSYIRPHRHLEDPKPECFLGIRGRMGLLVFDGSGRVDQVYCFGPKEDVVGVDIPPGVWHTVVCLEEGSVFFETKPGPFVPIKGKDMAPWAPEEGSSEAQAYLTELIGACHKASQETDDGKARLRAG